MSRVLKNLDNRGHFFMYCKAATLDILGNPLGLPSRARTAKLQGENKGPVLSFTQTCRGGQQRTGGCGLSGIDPVGQGTIMPNGTACISGTLGGG